MSRSSEVEACIGKAVEVLVRRDGPAFSMQALARKAGVSRATLYRHLQGRHRLAALIASARQVPAARERLIAAASSLVAERGLNGFNLEDVARRAEVSPTTLYREFSGRTELLRAVIETIAPAEGLAKLLSDHEAPPERMLQAFVTALLRRLEEQPLFLRLVLLGDAQDLVELRKLRRTQSSVSQALGAYLQAQVRAGRLRAYSASRLASSLFGLVLGARTASRLTMGEASSGSFEETAAEIVQIYLAGTAATGGSR